MKCEKCGYYNKSDKDICEKCGSPLEKNPVLKYKQKATNSIPDSKSFSTTEKLIIAIFTIGILMLIASAVIPSDFDFSSVLGSDNNTQDNGPVVINDSKIRIDTMIQVVSAGFGGENQIIVNANVKDINNYPVNGGIASITINGVKYSGNVENGNVNIVIPKTNEEKPRVTVVYEGNEEYNPSEITTTIEITKINTKIDVEEANGTYIATLKTANDEVIKDAKINVLYSDNKSEEKITDDTGRITIDSNLTPGINRIKFSYAGNNQYNPSEKIIEVENEKIDTKIEAKFNQEDNSIIAKLTDVTNNPIDGADLKIMDNNNQSIVSTNNQGIVNLSISEGSHNISIKYDGNDTYNPSETTITVIIEENNTHNSTVNDTVNNTVNDTENITKNNIHNDSNNNSIEQNNISSNNSTNRTDDTVNNTNNGGHRKINTTIKSEVTEDNSSVEIQLISEDNKAISGENIIIKLDNGTEITEKTDSNGIIRLNLDDLSGIDKMEFEFLGGDDYSSTDDYIII